MPVPRQAHREFGEFPDFAVHGDRAAVLLRYNVVADRQTEAGSFAGRLGRKERPEQLVLDLGPDAGAVVAHPDLDRLAILARRHPQGRLERSVAALPGAPRSRIKTVAEQVEKDAGHLLRRHLYLLQRRGVVALQRDVEALILGAGTVISEVQRVVDQ